jgi:NHLM bacteriocin system ABC transporter ATP-binding protein
LTALLASHVARPPSPREVTHASPLELTDTGADSGAPLRIVDGHVDVFAIVEADGRQLGNRRFIRSAGPGDLVFTVPEAEGRPSCRLCVFTAERALLVPFDEADPVVLAPLVDAWLLDLTQAVVQAGGGRQGGSLMLPGDGATFPAGSLIRATRGVVWLEVTKGSAAVLGDGHAILSPGMRLPVTNDSWIEAGADGVTLQAATTGTCVAGKNWWRMLDPFHARALAVLAAATQASLAREADRIGRSVGWSRRAFETAVAGLSGILGGHAATRRQALEDPLTAACRAVAREVGVEIPRQLRKRPASDAGILEQIVRLTRMPAREVTLYGAWWHDELGPMVGFLRESAAPVALLPGRECYRLHDPATGRETRIDAAEAERVGASAVVLAPTLPSRPLSLRDIMRFGLLPSRRDIVTMLAMGAVGSTLGLSIPVATGLLIDQFIPSHLRSQLLQVGAVLLCVTAVMVIAKLTGDRAQLRVAGRAANRLQTAIVDRTIRLSSNFLHGFSSADLAQRVMVIDAVNRALGVIVVDALLAGIFSLVSFILLLALSPGAAAAAVLLLVPFVGVTVWAGMRQLPELTQSEAHTAEASQLAFQMVQNIAHLRAAGAEERAFARWAEIYRDSQVAQRRASRINTVFLAFVGGYGLLSLTGFFGALMVLRTPAVSSGTLLIMVATYSRFLMASSAFAKAMQGIVRVLPKIRRARVLLAAEPEVDASKVDPGELSGRVAVDHVSFGYVEGAPPVLDDISLAIEAGQFVAFVGASGCGKTTLMKLMLGFERSAAGSVFYDGQDLRKIDVQSVRRQIGVVLQAGALMPGTIAENILGVTGGTNQQAWKAARQAGLAEDIEAMPMGMHTVLTDGATTLSGGQMQRLLLARALIGRPRIIFLDEATSALDNATQAVVMESLQRIAVTRIVIAHRLSTIQKADRIFVFDAGRVVQAGSYDELAHVPGLFAELVRRQVL